MALSLYDAIVPSYVQILGSVSGLLDKAEAHCAQHSVAPETILQARLAEDMLPFVYQVKSACVHSISAIESARKGVFSPDRTPPPQTFVDLKARVSDTLTALEALDRAEIDAFVGRDMAFQAGERRMEFTAENFLLSFSQPNFYFHSATAYDILRWKGLPVGKRDFLGQLRLKP